MDRLTAARRIAAYFAAAGCLWIAGHSLYNFFQRLQSVGETSIVVTISTVLAIGLFYMNRFARRVAAALCLLGAIITPVGYINPSAAMDMEAVGNQLPGVASIFLWMGPLLLALVVLAWLLDPPRPKASGDIDG